VARFVLVLDTPGIKQWVFGTDPLAEVRGASALLDRLNREETTTTLRRLLPAGVTLTEVYAAGGVGNYILDAPATIDAADLRRAVDGLAREFRHQSGGELRVVYGLAPLTSDSYREAVTDAFAEIHLHRDCGSARHALQLTPFLMECQSASHLPAAGVVKREGERLLLSEATRIKRNESWRTHWTGVWTKFMQFLAQRYPDWPQEEDTWVRKLRPHDTTDVGAAAQRKGYIGLVYADGNAMGRLVQELDSPATAGFFSKLVDGQIRRACHEALEDVLRGEIEQVCQAQRDGKPFKPLPADILLLGGDDLMVLLPAERALPFSCRASRLFEDYTRIGIDQEKNRAIRDFFVSRLNGHGMTFSCGVAVAPESYPFYLLLELAEQLLKSAKKGGSSQRNGGRNPKDQWTPSYIDFHLVAGSSGNQLSVIRRDDYQAESGHRRTLRPYKRETLDILGQAVEDLREARVPQSKLHDLFEAALDPAPNLAQRRSRELFSRLRKTRERNERQALWSALVRLGPLNEFPWYGTNSSRSTALADVVEAMDLFPRRSTEPET
jgi:hypothetical protein